MKTALYRHYDADGTLLYVGIATHHLTRLAAHMRVSDWADRIATVRIEHFETRAHALDAERRAVKAERPRHNIQHRTCAIGAPEGSLLHEIETAAHALGISPSTLGERVGQGGRFYARLREGKRAWPETIAKVRKRISELREEANRSESVVSVTSRGTA